MSTETAAAVQRAEDMLAAMQHQRDTALNAMVNAHADIAALRREVAALTERLASSDISDK